MTILYPARISRDGSYIERSVSMYLHYLSYYFTSFSFQALRGGISEGRGNFGNAEFQKRPCNWR